MGLKKEEKWQIVAQNNDQYDGKFFYGVKTTGIFCRPSCKSKQPSKENIVFFDNRQQAYDFGLRPCKRCRPDLADFNPMLDLLKQAKDIIEKNYDNKAVLEEQLKNLGVSKNHFISQFRSQYQCTPGEFIRKLRIAKAKSMLLETKESILKIALDSGFTSLSNFYSCFKQQLNMTPTEFRKNSL